jgi:CRP-like cAMP-binding protein
MARNSLRYLTDNDWILINATAKRVSFRLGEEIVREGVPGDTLYIVRRGSASVELPNARSTVAVALLEEGDVCGDMAFVEKGIATASVTAKDEEVEADAIAAEDLQRLLDSFPGVGYRFYRSLAVVLTRRLRDTSRELVRTINTTKP